MNVNLNETVTLSVQTYEDMKEEIKSLKKLVQQNTIIEEVLPDKFWYIQQAIYVSFLIGTLILILIMDYKIHY